MSDNMSAIDRAIALAKARKAAKGNGAQHPMHSKETPMRSSSKQGKVAKEKSGPTDAEKAAKKAAQAAERAEKKLARDVVRAAKKAAKEAERKPAHLGKVERAALRLPFISENAQVLFDDATTNLSALEIAALSAHLTHFNRAKATERAIAGTTKLEEGDIVRVISGDARYIDQVGVVTKSARIRCFVSIDGIDKDVYLFVSDVERVEVPAETVVETDEETQGETATEEETLDEVVNA